MVLRKELEVCQSTAKLIPRVQSAETPVVRRFPEVNGHPSGAVSTSTTHTDREGAYNTLTGPDRSSPQGPSSAGVGIIVCLSFVKVSHHGAASIPFPFLAPGPVLCHDRPGLRPFRRGRPCFGRLFRPGNHPGGSLVAPSRCR